MFSGLWDFVPLLAIPTLGLLVWLGWLVWRWVYDYRLNQILERHTADFYKLHLRERKRRGRRKRRG
jgi:hypothetical protein